MAFSYTLTNAAVTNTDPAGTDLISLGDDNIRNFKSAVIERVNSRIADVNSDPWIIKSPIGGSGNVQSIIPVSDNLYTLGEAARRWSDIRAVQATIVTLSATSVVAAGITGPLQTATQPNVTSLGTLTGLTVGTSAGGQIITAVNSLANAFYFSGQNTGGRILWGVESSAGGFILGGTTAYAAVFGTEVARAVHFATNNLVRQTIDASGNTTFTGTVENPGFIVPASNVKVSLGNDNFGAYPSIGYNWRATGGGGYTYIGLDYASRIEFYQGGFRFYTAPSSVGAITFSQKLEINQAGNAVFSGTVTAANFVGPTSIDANNLTGNTLAAGVVNSSLQNFGTITALNVSGRITLTGNNTLAVGVIARSNLVGLGFHGAAGSSYSFYFANDIGNDTLYNPVGTTNVVVVGNLTAASFTGTILTAAQANITSLGTLTSLTSSGSIRSTGGDIRSKSAGSDSAAAGAAFYLSNVAETRFIALQLSSSNHLDIWGYDGASWLRSARFTNDGKVLVGTTDATGVAVGGMRVIGNSYFDNYIQFRSTNSVYTTDGVWNANARPSILNTPGSSLLFGYHDAGAGQYAPSLGFSVGGATYNAGLRAIQIRGISTDTDNRFELRYNGDLSWGPGNAAIDTTIGRTGVNILSFNNAAVTGVTNITSTTFTGNLSGTILTSAQANITSLGTLTSLNISGTGGFLQNSAATTSAKYIRIINTGGDILFGVESSVGGASLFSGTGAYGLGIATLNATSLYIGTNNTNRFSIDSAGAGNFLGTLTAGAFSGPLTGNVTGTILTAAQANITSLGTLTGLALGGHTTISTDATYDIGDNTHRHRDIFTVRLKGLPPFALGDQTGATVLLAKLGNGDPLGASTAQNKWLEVTGSDGVNYYVPAWI